MFHFGLRRVVQTLEVALAPGRLMAFGEYFLLPVLVDDGVLNAGTEREHLFANSELTEDLHGARLQSIGAPDSQGMGRPLKDAQRHALADETSGSGEANRTSYERRLSVTDGIRIIAGMTHLQL